MRRIFSLVMVIMMIFSNIVVATGLNDTTEFLEKQQLDEWGILTLYSYGKNVEDKELDRVDDSEITTDYEAYIMGAVSMGRDVTDYAERIAKTQMSDGKFSDFIDGTGDEFLNAHIWGIISLYIANYDNYNKEKSLEWLKENQNEDGGFSIFKSDENSNLDLTAMALIAYDIAGMDKNSEEVKKAVEFIENNLDKYETSETISYYILSRIKLGLDVDKELYNRLMKYKLKDESFTHIKRKNPRGNYIATWHGLLAMIDYQNGYSIFDKIHNLNRFKDLKKGDYAYKEIIDLVNNKIVIGNPDGTFKPNNYVKRGEFAKFLIYGLKLEDEIVEETDEFVDLKGHWSNKIVNVAIKHGVLEGMKNDNGDKIFMPEDEMIGAQIATIIVRTKGLENEAKKIKSVNWYDGYVKIAKQYDLLYENFKAEDKVTRAQCAMIISKIK